MEPEYPFASRLFSPDERDPLSAAGKNLAACPTRSVLASDRDNAEDKGLEQLLPADILARV
jgi:hypothetical protein